MLIVFCAVVNGLHDPRIPGRKSSVDDGRTMIISSSSSSVGC
jgi:hypothetical protein